MIVVDASCIVDSIVSSERQAAARGHLRRWEYAHAPHLIDVEVLHALRRWTMRGELDAGLAAEALDAFASALPLIRHPQQQLSRRTWALRDRLTAYDATYVALSELLDLPLLTADARVARGAEGLVEVILVA